MTPATRSESAVRGATEILARQLLDSFGMIGGQATRGRDGTEGP